MLFQGQRQPNSRPKDSRFPTTIPWSIRLNTQLGIRLLSYVGLLCLYGLTLPSSGEFGTPRSSDRTWHRKFALDRQTSHPKTLGNYLDALSLMLQRGSFNKLYNFRDALAFWVRSFNKIIRKRVNIRVALKILKAVAKEQSENATV